MAESVIVAALLRGKPGKEDELAGRLHALVHSARRSRVPIDRRSK